MTHVRIVRTEGAWLVQRRFCWLWWTRFECSSLENAMALARALLVASGERLRLIGWVRK